MAFSEAPAMGGDPWDLPQENSKWNVPMGFWEGAVVGRRVSSASLLNEPAL